MFKITFFLLFTGLVSAVDRKARDLGVRCDGRSDDTNNMNRAIASLGDGDTLELPANAVCPISNILRIENKKNIRIFGGDDKTVILARRAAFSAIFIRNSNGITLENFKHNSPYSSRVLWSAESCGISMNTSSSIKIINLEIQTPANMGIFVIGSKDVLIESNTIVGSFNHGLNIRSASQNVIVQKNTVRNSARDGLSVIDWQSDIKSKNIRFLNNVVSNITDVGIRVGTAEDVEVSGNKISETQRSGIQMQCAPPNGNGLTNVWVHNNELTNCPRANTDNNRWDAGIVGTTNLQILEHLNVENNIIREPKARAPQGHDTVGIRFSTANEGFINDLNVMRNQIFDSTGEVKRCVSDLAWFSIGENNIEGNKLNGGTCPEDV